MDKSHSPPNFLAAGIGLSGSRTMSKLRKKEIKDLRDITVYYPEDPDLPAFNLDAQLRTPEDLEGEMSGLSLLFLAADFEDGSSFDILPGVMEKATKDGVHVLLFPVSDRFRGKLGYNGEINQKLCIVELLDHHLTSQDEIIINGIKALSDMYIGPDTPGADYKDIKQLLESSPGCALLAQGLGSSWELALEDAFACYANEGVDLRMARGLVVGVAVGHDPRSSEMLNILSLVRDVMSEGAEIAAGLTNDPLLGDEIRVSVFAFGFDAGSVPSQ